MILKNFSSFLLILPLIALAIADDTDYLLPKTVRPKHYSLEVNVQFPPTNYSGRVNIFVDILEPTNKITLHSTNIKCETIEDCFIEGISGKYSIQSIEKNDEFMFATLKMNSLVPPGPYEMAFSFAGNYDSYKGFYNYSYVTTNGTTEYEVLTQFEPAYAREVFPCFDEPNLKATFNLSIKHPKEYFAISNSKVLSVESINENDVRTVFETTKKMSLYLLAWSVLNYDKHSGIVNSTGTEISIYTDHTTISAAYQLGLETAISSVYYLQELTKVNYTLPKLDLYPTKAFIFAGGMENWGLIIYNKKNIIADASAISNDELLTVMDVIIHEICHQWFGNLVTMEWWDYSWLHEGFATYYSHRIADKIRPDLRAEESFLSRVQNNLRYESYENHFSLNEHVLHQSGFMIKFGPINYQKGYVTVRMMHKLFPGFDKAITKYLNENSFGSVTPSDLYNAIDSEETRLPQGLTVGEIMSSWTNFGGIPLVTVNVSSGSMNVSQMHYRTVNVSPDPSKLWYIPVTFTTEKESNFDVNVKYWLPDTERSMQFPLPEKDNGWVIVNLQNTAFMRVNYDVENWKKIIEFLNGPNFEQIPITNRIQIISDATNFQKYGHLSATIVLELLNYLKQEKDSLPMEGAEPGIITLHNFLKDTEAYPKYQKFVAEIMPENGPQLLETADDIHFWTENLVNKWDNKFEQAAVLDKLASRIYSPETDLPKIQLMKQSLDTESVELLAHLETASNLNVECKENFIQNEYEAVAKWLHENY